VWALRAHSWPGNVRELQNVMEHAVVLLEPGADVQAADIPFICDQRVNPDALLAEDSRAVEESYYEARERLLSKFDRRYLTRVVLRAGGNLSKAARLAQVDRTTFYRLMERHGLHRNLLAGDTE
jgi:DNA-binding NtrC family response regulator